MKKCLAVAFLASSALLNTLEGTNTNDDDLIELFSGSKSQQSEINRREAKFCGFSEEQDKALVTILDKHDDDVLNERKKWYQVEKLITGEYVHDFVEGRSYPIVQSYVDIEDEPLISEKLLMIGEAFGDLSKGIKQQETRQENQDSLFIETFIQTLQGKKLVIKTEELEKITIPVYHWNKKTMSHPTPFWERHGEEILLVRKGGEKPKIKVISSNWKSQDYVNSDEILGGTYSEDKINRTRVKVFDWQFIK